MRALVPACAIALALGVSASAQDSTVKSKTKVDADDARTVVMTGCLQRSSADGAFMLNGASGIAADDLTVRSRVKTDVDDDDVEVKTSTKTDVDKDDRRPVGTSGTVRSYEIMPRDGVDLAAHVGHRVEIAAVMIDPADGDDDAEIEVETRTKARVDDAPDAGSKTKTEIEVPRGAQARLAAMSVKAIGGGCN
jgi:hypothetical protein